LPFLALAPILLYLSEHPLSEDFMRTLFGLPFLAMTLMFATLAQAKLSDRQAMKCISQDRQSQSRFLDLEQAYEMRSVSAKDFYKVFDKAANCPQLKKNISKLHGDMIARLPTPQNRSSIFKGNSGSDDFSGAAAPSFPVAPSSTPSTPATPGFPDDSDLSFLE
jgi:hypothetical protein